MEESFDGLPMKVKFIVFSSIIQGEKLARFLMGVQT